MAPSCRASSLTWPGPKSGKCAAAAGTGLRCVVNGALTATRVNLENIMVNRKLTMMKKSLSARFLSQCQADRMAARRYKACLAVAGSESSRARGAARKWRRFGPQVSGVTTRRRSKWRISRRNPRSDRRRPARHPGSPQRRSARPPRRAAGHAQRRHRAGRGRCRRPVQRAANRRLGFRRRRRAVAANDDRASVGQMLQAMRHRPTRTPYIIAGVAAVPLGRRRHRHRLSLRRRIAGRCSRPRASASPPWSASPAPSSCR